MQHYEDYHLSVGADINCTLCFGQLNSSEKLVAHTGSGKSHPLHQRCAQAAIETWQTICPVCKVPLDSSSAYGGWKERMWGNLRGLVSNPYVKTFCTSVCVSSVSSFLALLANRIISTEKTAAALSASGFLYTFIAGPDDFNSRTMAVFASAIGNLMGAALSADMKRVAYNHVTNFSVLYHTALSCRVPKMVDRVFTVAPTCSLTRWQQMDRLGLLTSTVSALGVNPDFKNFVVPLVLTSAVFSVIAMSFRQPNLRAWL